MINTKNESNETPRIVPRKANQGVILWKRFIKNRISIAGLIFFFTFFIIAIIGPYICPHDPSKLNYGREYEPPSNEFRLGTDPQGRDVLSFIIYGTRTSFFISIGALFIELIIAFTIGGISGYFGGWTDEILMRITDLILSLPTIMLILLAISMFKVRSGIIITLLMGFLNWPGTSRIIRSSVISLKEADFVLAVRSHGASHKRIILRHILPNAMSPIIVLSTVHLARFIMLESALNFIGLGDPSAISWGVLIQSGASQMRTAPWITTFPGLAIIFTTIGLNLLGDGLRDAFDVRI